MNIEVIDRQKDLLIDPKRVQRIVQLVIENEGQTAEEVAIYFVNIEEIGALHAQFFNDPSPTDCISFPIDSPDVHPRFLGEVFICPAIALQYASQHQKDPKEETTLYLVHGLLHLMGYDDIEEKDEKNMRNAEKQAMNLLKKQRAIL